MKVSKTLIENIRRLLAGERIAASALRKDIAEALLSEGFLTVQVHGSRRSYRAINVEGLRNFLSSRYEELRQMDNAPAYVTRSEQAADTGNSKLVKVRSCPGFPVNSYEAIVCSLRGCEFVVNPPEGSFVFIDDWQSFVIPEEVTVVGIENMENFRMIRRQQQFIENYLHSHGLSGIVLFVSRYPQSTDLRNWLQTIPNHYLHFGDFDLAGIHIFLSEFHRYLGIHSSFLIPDDIELRLAKGSMARYDEQYDRFHSLRCDMPDLQALIDLINKYHRGYDQEGYIMKQIEVVAAIIHDERGRIFATQRGYGEWKDWWEFPGGKMEAGETPEEALKREIWEELETRIVVERLVDTVEWDYPQFHLTMHCYLCHVESGHLELKEHEAAKWLNKDELESVNWLPADWELVRKLEK